MPNQTPTPLFPSLLDRLIEGDGLPPGSSRSLRAAVRGRLETSIAVDVQNLLNTRARILSLPDYWPELQISVVGYGLPDFRRWNFEDQRVQQKLVDSVAEVLRKYEPRLANVAVELAGWNSLQNRLTMKIHGEVGVNLELLSMAADYVPVSGWTIELEQHV